MTRQVVCSRLVGRDEELSRLEGALLAANRGESRFVVLAGEAGIGKTRLASEMRRRVRKIGWTTMWGGCSEADLALPYLPFLEALGNHLAGADAEEIGRELGAARHELAQLFPQLATAPVSSTPGDPTQAKLRLFESIVALLSIPARRSGLLLVVEDIHWADGPTQELLDYIARRVRGLRTMVLVTYRSDELHRRHPLLPTIQGWRRSGLADVIELDQMSRAEIGEMLSSILETPDLAPNLRELMHERSEGNPFVLEEVLKEALDAGELRLTHGQWDGSSLRHVLPRTVRDTILLRLERLDAAEVEVLEAAAVLGRAFDYPALEATANAPASVVEAALGAAVREQLVLEDRGAPGRYRFRHALTQEAIYSEMIAPRRQQLHSRAADALAGRGDKVSFDLASHLLGARRYEEAVPACLEAAHHAIRTYAYGTAVTLYELVLDHVDDPRTRAEVVARLGEALWLDGRPAAAERALDEGIRLLEEVGERKATAHYLVVRGRARWERSQPQRGLEDYEAAGAILEPLGPSRDLAVAHIRISGVHLFQLDGARCAAAAEKAAAIAAEAGAEDERAWAIGFLGMGRFVCGEPDALDTVVEGYRLAAQRGAVWIAANHAWNEVWTRVHAGAPQIRDALERLEAVRHQGARDGMWLLARSYVRKAEGDLRGALDDSSEAHAIFESAGADKMQWRAALVAAEVLTEMGRLQEAGRFLPPISTRLELQDAVYDSRAHIRHQLDDGDVDAARACARSLVEQGQRLALYRFLVALAVEVLAPAGELDACARLLRTGRTTASPYGTAYLDQAEARLELAYGNSDRALELARAAASSLAGAGLRLDELRARVLVGEAALAAGRADEAAGQLAEVMDRARAADARSIHASAAALASGAGLDLPEVRERLDREGPGPGQTRTGEKLVTIMFADVRGYTAMSQRRAPAEMADLIATLQRWAREEVEKHGGIVDKFAGDAVMATFNVSGDSIDHARDALEAAIGLRDKAALMDLALGVGVAVGPAIVGALTPGANVSVLGAATNMAARLQAEAGPGELLLGEEAFRRVEPWLRERGLRAVSEQVSLKGIGPVTAYRLR